MGHPMTARLQPPSPQHVRRMKMYCLHSIITHDVHNSSISLSLQTVHCSKLNLRPCTSCGAKRHRLLCATHPWSLFVRLYGLQAGCIGKDRARSQSKQSQPAQESRPLAKEASTLPLTAVSCYVTTHSCYCKRGHLSVSDISKGHREEK
jgi:hypothetical protein